MQALIMILVALVLSGCNTMGGLKEDLSGITDKISGNESETQDTTKIEDNRQCVRNFSKQSGLINYRTTATLNGVSRKTAVLRLVKILGRKGFVVHEKDTVHGSVNATFDAGGSGIQISAFITSVSGGSSAELNYVGTGASLGSLLVPKSAYRNDMCEYIEAMQTGS